MLTVAEATKAIADAMPSYVGKSVEIEEAVGRVLRQTIRAERDQPPFDRVTMDGIAIRFESFASGNRAFRIEGTQLAGDPVQTLADTDGCIEIMTGGVLPAGTNCIIPVERVVIENGSAILEDGYSPEQAQFIHPQGSDYREGHVLLEPGQRITPMDIAIIASSGLEQVKVGRLPGVRVISTGNELVPAREAVAPHQIRMSNGPALVTMLTQQGFQDVSHELLIDEPSILEARLSRLLQRDDVLILSGGVSMGKADYVPQVLANLGVEVVFHKISQRPGKPMWFGIGQDGQAVFALPGNPVSTLVCCRHYVLPALLHACGRKEPSREFAMLAEDVSFNPQLTCFLPVRISASDNGCNLATPIATNTSGDFAALSGTDGYIELALEKSEFARGSAMPFYRWSTP